MYDNTKNETIVSHQEGNERREEIGFLADWGRIRNLLKYIRHICNRNNIWTIYSQWWLRVNNKVVPLYNDRVHETTGQEIMIRREDNGMLQRMRGIPDGNIFITKWTRWKYKVQSETRLSTKHNYMTIFDTSRIFAPRTRNCSVCRVSLYIFIYV